MSGNGNVQVSLWQNADAALGPLDQAQGRVFEVIANAHKLQLLWIGEAIQVEVKDLAGANLIGFHQGKGRAFHRPDMAQAANDAARQGGLAGAQITVQVQGAAPLGQRRQACAQGQHGFFALDMQGHDRHGARSSNN